MKSIVYLLCATACVLGLAVDSAQLSQVQSVYLLPMANGLDQFLANRLTTSGVFQVVTDTRKADAVFTDRLGEALEKRLDELYPVPVPAAAEPETTEAQAEESRDESKVGEERPVRSSTFGRAKGTVFLIDVRTRAVIWSTYERPKNLSPEQLDRTAHRIAQRLQRDLKGK